jgi:hypothetical protein
MPRCGSPAGRASLIAKPVPGAAPAPILPAQDTHPSNVAAFHRAYGRVVPITEREAYWPFRKARSLTVALGDRRAQREVGNAQHHA